MRNFKKLFGYGLITRENKMVWSEIRNKNSYLMFDQSNKDVLYMELYKPEFTEKDITKYYITESLNGRIRDTKDNVRNILSSEELYKLLRNKCSEKVGFVYRENGIHFIYSKSDRCINLFIFENTTLNNIKKGTTSPQEYKYKYLNSRVIGMFRLEKDTCVFDLDNLKGVLLHPQYYISSFKSRKNSFLSGLKILDRHSCNKVFVAEVKKTIKNHSRNEGDYNRKAEIMLSCFYDFVYLKTVPITDKTFIAPEGKGIKYKDKQPPGTGVIRVDSHYDTNTYIINPFAVRGHFRNQPKKSENGEWYKDIIYIDGFTKSGYHRRATKIIVEKNNKREG